MSSGGSRRANEGSGPEGVGPLGTSGPGDGPSLPPALVRFVELFNQGRFWDSHEALEGPWRDSRSELYHGLILLASAWVHAKRGNPNGIRAQLGKALAALETFPGAYLGLDVDELRREARVGRRLVARHRGDPPPDWLRVVPPPLLRLRRERIRGDEPEGSGAG